MTKSKQTETLMHNWKAVLAASAALAVGKTALVTEYLAKAPVIGRFGVMAFTQVLPVVMLLEVVRSHFTFGSESEVAGKSDEALREKVSRIWDNKFAPGVNANWVRPDCMCRSILTIGAIGGTVAFGQALYTALQTEAVKTSLFIALEASAMPFAIVTLEAGVVLGLAALVHQGTDFMEWSK